VGSKGEPPAWRVLGRARPYVSGAFVLLTLRCAAAAAAGGALLGSLAGALLGGRGPARLAGLPLLGSWRPNLPRFVAAGNHLLLHSVVFHFAGRRPSRRCSLAA
jgi:hypothetical protein